MKTIETYQEFKLKLNGEYIDEFKKVEGYMIKYPAVSLIDVDNILMEVVDTFLIAQNQGRNIKSIIGQNIPSYCNNMILGHLDAKERKINIISKFLNVTMLILLAYLFYYISMINDFDFSKDITIGVMNIIIGVLTITIFSISFYALVKISKNMKIFDIIFAILGIFTMSIFFNIEYLINISKRMKINLSGGQYIVICILVLSLRLLVFVISCLVGREKNNNGIQVFLDKCEDAAKKRFEKKNTKLELANRETIRIQDFKRKEYKRLQVINIMLPIFSMIYGILVIVITYNTLIYDKVNIILITIYTIVNLITIFLIGMSIQSKYMFKYYEKNYKY